MGELGEENNKCFMDIGEGGGTSILCLDCYFALFSISHQELIKVGHKSYRKCKYIHNLWLIKYITAPLKIILVSLSVPYIASQGQGSSGHINYVCIYVNSRIRMLNYKLVIFLE